MPRKSRSRIKKVSYVLQVSCNKTHSMNENEFLESVRCALFQAGIGLEERAPRVSVLKRVEEFLSPAKENEA